ncbi:hypothetical protein C2845_PM07G23550 [Panicum miliaceum]|uniref:Uncharacterized protein n=1 Tax=Panicum miliaceum TaxID=4540 RepID=A0A3L6SUJ1_PANMI|nr:hypothetical protein C2845_PM07G23550 [Panicum miliaceum]
MHCTLHNTSLLPWLFPSLPCHGYAFCSCLPASARTECGSSLAASAMLRAPSKHAHALWPHSIEGGKAKAEQSRAGKLAGCSGMQSGGRPGGALLCPSRAVARGQSGMSLAVGALLQRPLSAASVARGNVRPLRPSPLAGVVARGRVVLPPIFSSHELDVSGPWAGLDGDPPRAVAIDEDSLLPRRAVAFACMASRAQLTSHQTRAGLLLRCHLRPARRAVALASMDALRWLRTARGACREPETGRWARTRHGTRTGCAGRDSNRLGASATLFRFTADGRRAGGCRPAPGRPSGCAALLAPHVSLSLRPRRRWPSTATMWRACPTRAEIDDLIAPVVLSTQSAAGLRPYVPRRASDLLHNKAPIKLLIPVRVRTIAHSLPETDSGGVVGAILWRSLHGSMLC